MSELIDKISQATSRLAQIEQEIADAEKEQKLHEENARAAHKRRVDLKEERQSLNRVLGHAQVAKGVQDAAAQAAAAKDSAEKMRAESAETLKRLEEKEKALDALLAKHAAPPAADASVTIA